MTGELSEAGNCPGGSFAARRVPSRPLKRGFTLIELLVVIAILALLVSILVPSLKQAKEAAQRAVCLSNLRHLGIAYHLYAEEEDTTPPAYYNNVGGGWDPPWYNLLYNQMHNLSWSNREMPYPPEGMWACPSYRAKMPWYQLTTYGQNSNLHRWTGWSSFRVYYPWVIEDGAARFDDIRFPGQTVIYVCSGIRDNTGSFNFRPKYWYNIGTYQLGTGFWHRGKTCAVFGDVHAETISYADALDADDNKNSDYHLRLRR